MPGAKDVRDLEPDAFGKKVADLSSRERVRRADKSLLSNALRPLADVPKREAAQGFAVKGCKVDALKGAHSVLAKDAKPSHSFSAQDTISVVFFSHMNNAFVHIESIERNGSDIEVEYRFIPRFEAQQTVNLALIPLGKLPPGKFNVRMVALPLEGKFIDLGIESVSSEHEARIVCRPFQFEVESNQ